MTASLSTAPSNAPPRPPVIALTAGEPAGIGLDLCVALAHQALATEQPAALVVLADPEALQARAMQLGQHIQLHPYQGPGRIPVHLGDGHLQVLPVPLSTPAIAGQLNVANSPAVLAMLDRALAGCQQGEFDAMVTAPVHKGIINQAGIAFSGHTEYLAEKTGTEKVVMMLVGGGMRVALVTTHLPLTQVSAAITPDTLRQTITILHQDLQQQFGIPQPHILVAGLNPHAGEDGYLGREEIDILQPVLAELRTQGFRLTGPLPADTLFSAHNLAQADAFLAMYHDQGLAVLKYASFGEGVNVTLGLPILRTSVDHGTALDIAGSGRADSGSLHSALQLAIQLAQQRRASL